MHIEVFFTSHEADEMSLRDKTVVVIDVLRASTTIAMALMNEAKEVIPVTTVESAMKIAGNLAGEVTLLGGERGGRMIDGFHLGNSPSEYTRERVKGKSVVFTTTNGSHAMAKARYAKEMLVCGFINVSTVQECLSEPQTDGTNRRECTVVCAGRDGSFSIEDAVCAGMVIQRLLDSGDADDLGDASSASLTLYRHHQKSLSKMLAHSKHGKYLQEIGFGDDIKICGEVDSIPVLPQMIGNVVKLKKPGSEKIFVSQ